VPGQPLRTSVTAAYLGSTRRRHRSASFRAYRGSSTALRPYPCGGPAPARPRVSTSLAARCP